MKEQTTSLRETVERKIEELFISFGKIHAEGREITHDDLDQLRTITAASVCEAIAKRDEELPQKFMNEIKHQRGKTYHSDITVATAVETLEQVLKEVAT